MKHPKYLSVADVAAILGVSARRVRAIIAKGNLAARRFDKKSWLILPAAVEHYQKRGIQPWIARARKSRRAKLDI